MVARLRGTRPPSLPRGSPVPRYLPDKDESPRRLKRQNPPQLPTCEMKLSPKPEPGQEPRKGAKLSPKHSGGLHFRKTHTPQSRTTRKSLGRLQRARDLLAPGCGHRSRRNVPEAQDPRVTALGPAATPQPMRTLVKLT